MSRRFGRQQRRKMRARVDALESAYARLRGRFEEQEMINRRNREIVELTAAVVGRYFITMDPASVEVQHLDALGPTWRVAVEQSIEELLWNATPDVPSAAEFVARALPIIKGSAAQDDLRGKKHFRFTYGGHLVGYAVAPDAIGLLPRDVAVREVAVNMARMLLDSVD